ncbi:hypothetical protein A0H81_11631 [Grifola frondosa]|uniref:Uncharacterized protein n=1 Tax=Grifola frondosa TaxID=5627 RepID=A0A1C7LZX3_GRIFR|nr:hypothetical protein A0H81_11631 [Grifola frondosa]
MSLLDLAGILPCANQSERRGLQCAVFLPSSMNERENIMDFYESAAKTVYKKPLRNSTYGFRVGLLQRVCSRNKETGASVVKHL